ncbi:hypothetical protein [Bartonella apihabitans]|nr:hypothetical protein [Bartonella apihabitans]
MVSVTERTSIATILEATIHLDQVMEARLVQDINTTSIIQVTSVHIPLT